LRFVAMLSSPLLVICDADVCARAGWTLIDFATACFDGGARLLQIRAKHSTGRRLLDDARTIVERAAGVAAQVIVNDRADIARMAGAAGVHVGQDDLTPAMVRTILGDAAIVGKSSHTAAQRRAALAEPISYLAVGPIFETATKATGFEAVGVEGVRAAAALAAPRGIPVVAIGGITIDRAEAIIANGAAAVAVISDLLATGDPHARVRDYLRRLSRV
jgi:thiamine-phosphate pyrophosphorylase